SSRMPAVPGFNVIIFSMFNQVLLITSVGDIDIELWTKEVPKACRNFIQLCLEHYYDETIFHRIVKGFCVQGGDPTGTGFGEYTVYFYVDEFHQRLRFNRRGLVAMANSGPNDNGSQFFFTLERADELNGKHTIFGKVAGNTVYNMLKMADLEVDDNDHPFYPPKIKRTEVLSNPFDDIEPRDNHKNKKEEATAAKKPKVKGTKNFSLLSFGEEAEEDEEEVASVTKELKMKSSHDILDDPTLSKESTTTDSPPQKDAAKISEEVRQKLKKRQDDEDDEDEDEDDDDDDSSDEETAKNSSKRYRATLCITSGLIRGSCSQLFISIFNRNQLQQESNKLLKEIRESRKKPKSESEDQKHKAKDHLSHVVADFRAERHDYMEKVKETIKTKGGGRSEQTFSFLADFQAKLDEGGGDSPDESDNEEIEDDIGWMSHALKCEGVGQKVKDASIQDEDTFEIFDPRNPINKRRREASKEAMKAKKRR
ncbi:hypothetical protein QZH41_012247, partial [Actinostola sp. cb2023]